MFLNKNTTIWFIHISKFYLDKCKAQAIKNMKSELFKKWNSIQFVLCNYKLFDFFLLLHSSSTEFRIEITKKAICTKTWLLTRLIELTFIWNLSLLKSPRYIIDVEYINISFQKILTFHWAKETLWILYDCNS